LTVNLTLSGPGGGAVLGTPPVAMLKIATPDPLLEFSAPAYTVAAAGPRAVIGVRRLGPLTAEVTASFATADGSATAGADYTATSGTLTFGPGNALQTFAVPVANDAQLEGSETVLLTLTAAGGGAGIGARSAATLTIASDDASVAFGAFGFSAAESVPQATIV